MMIGRLAPSPTGPLHLGNLSSLGLAWAHARAHGARLIYRVEDIDAERIVPGCAEAQMRDLQWLGIEWDDGPDRGGAASPYTQSAATHRYNDALRSLDSRGLVYRCTCSRRDIQDILSAPHEQFDPATRYPGTCANDDDAVQEARASKPHAMRVRVTGVERVVDEVAGTLEHELAVNPGDFVIVRRDGCVAYQLAVVVDDGYAGVTHVVRGRDLLDSTPRQAFLHRMLGTPPPATLHVPLVLGPDGERLSKRDQSLSVDRMRRQGWTREQIWGLLTWLWGWQPAPRPVDPAQIPTMWCVAEPLRADAIRLPHWYADGPTGREYLDPHANK